MKYLKPRSNKALFKYERCADRFATELPVEIDGVRGVTRNISATGVYFETHAAQTPGSRVRFTVEVIVQGEKTKVPCEGEVVRVDHNRGRMGVAAKLEKSFFSDATEIIVSQPGERMRLH